MRKRIDLAFQKPEGAITAGLYDADGKSINLIAELTYLFPVVPPGKMVCVRIIADDGTEEYRPFDLETASEILKGTLQGRFMTREGKEARIYDTGLKGDHPVLGVVDGRAVQWNANGKPADGKQSDELEILVLKEASHD